MFPDYFRVPVGALRKTGLIGRFPKIGTPWNGAENSRPCVSCGGAHDDGSHGLKCLMGLRTVKNTIVFICAFLERQDWQQAGVKSYSSELPLSSEWSVI